MNAITLAEATTLSSKILSLVLIVNSLEYFYLTIKSNFLDAYPWKILQKKSFNFFPFEKKEVFTLLILINFILAIILLNSSSPFIFLALFIIQWLFFVRFGGPFNGGSDSLLLLILFCFFLHFYFLTIPLVSTASILYLAIQVILSYMIAGAKKLKNADWQTGRALPKLATNNSFLLADFYKDIFKNRLYSTTLGYFVVFFELSFFMIMKPKLTAIYLTVGFLFHFINFFIFGLNRFLFIWIATYPILLFFVQFMQAKFL